MQECGRGDEEKPSATELQQDKRVGRVGGVFYRERRRVVVVVDAREVIKRMILTLGNLSKVMFPPPRRNQEMISSLRNTTNTFFSR